MRMSILNTATTEQILGERNFTNYPNLKTVTIKGVLSEISNSAFEGCKQIKSITATGAVNATGKKALYLGECAFKDCTGLESVEFTGSLVVSKNAFEGCTNLGSVKVKESDMALLENYAFLNCTKLTEVDIPGGLLIQEGAFSECTSLKKFDFSKEFGNIDPKYISEAEGEWKGKKKAWTPSFWSKLVAACVILALISTVLSNPKVQAAIKNLALSIGETLGFQKEIEPYTEALNISQTDQGITANIKEVVLDEGVLLFRVHAEIDNTEENEKKKTANISSFRNTGITLDMGKTTINGQKLDEYMNAEYSPYSVDDLLDADADSDEKEYDRVQEYRFHAPTDLGENPEIHLVLNAFDYDDWEKSVAEFTFDFNISREKILKQTTNKELENISVQTEEGTVTLKDIFLNKLQSSISADVPEKLFQKYEVELRGTDSKGNKVRYELKDDAETEAISRNWKFKTDFWRTYGSAGDDERPELPDPDSEYLELQLYLKSDDIMESNITETYDLDDDTYAEEEGKVYDAGDDSEWKAVGEKIRINIR